MEKTQTYIVLILILFSIYNIAVLILSDWIAKHLGMTGLIHYCTVIVLWTVLFVGILKISMDIKTKSFIKE